MHRGLEQGRQRILDLSKAYRLKPGTGWLVGPCLLPAPAPSAPTTAVGSDVFGMYRAWWKGVKFRGLCL